MSEAYEFALPAEVSDYLESLVGFVADLPDVVIWRNWEVLELLCHAADATLTPSNPNPPNDTVDRSFTKNEKLRDLHARWHELPGESLGMDGCGGCSFWLVAEYTMRMIDAPLISDPESRAEGRGYEE